MTNKKTIPNRINYQSEIVYIIGYNIIFSGLIFQLMNDSR
jgi:hypothetical protein